MNCEFAGDTITGRHQEGPEEEWRISNSRVTRSLDDNGGGMRGGGEGRVCGSTRTKRRQGLPEGGSGDSLGSLEAC